MNENLSKSLLKRDAMQWTDSEWTKERRDLKKLSEYKYDEYQQFTAGKRFVENLYLWLKQFSTIHERKEAYTFIKNNLIFISNFELDHLIKMAYPDAIMQYLVKLIATTKKDIDENHITRILKNKDFEILRDQCLFLGLSDGARIDVFRRHSGLDHEQVYSTYLISDDKTDEFLDKLRTKLKSKKIDDAENRSFRAVFLLDDFSGSGVSFIRKKGEEFKGKLKKFYTPIKNKKYVSKLFESPLRICVVLYVATTRAKNHIEQLGNEFFKGENVDFSVLVIQEINDSFRIDELQNSEFYKIVLKYYDPKIEKLDSYTTGNLDKPHLGFDGCGLIIVLSHNCPNNSLPIIWYGPMYQYRGLFPRVERFPERNE
jgi:hypothetical protein